jgi:hypothetical protein
MSEDIDQMKRNAALHVSPVAKTVSQPDRGGDATYPDVAKLSNLPEVKSFGQKALDWAKETHASQIPTLKENGAALYRQGREDFMNILMGQNLAREPGAPDTPTQTQVNQDLGIVPEIDEMKSRGMSR